MQVINHAELFGPLLAREQDDEGLATALLLADLARIEGDEATAFALSILGDEARRTVVTSGDNG